LNAKSSPFSIYDLIGYFIPGASALFICSTLLTVNGHHWFHGQIASVDSLEAYLPFFLAAYAVGQLNALLSSLTIERYAIYAHGYPSKTLLNLPHVGYWSSVGKLWGWVLAVVILPVSVIDCALGRVLGLSKFSGRPLDNLLDTILRRRIYRLLRTFNYGQKINPHGDAVSSDFFRLVYHYAVENAPSHLPKMQNYVALFGFFRAFALIFVLAFWLEVAFGLRSLDIDVSVDWYALGRLSLFGVLSYLFFVGFLKFYRRFSLEALLAAAVVFEPPKTFRKIRVNGGVRWPKKNAATSKGPRSGSDVVPEDQQAPAG
jgi:hypothetical protein